MPELFECGNGLKFPRGGWKFNQDVANVFQQHVHMSIPGYSLVHKYISEMCSSQVINGKTLNVLDLGCSIGDLERRIVGDNNIDIHIDAVDLSESMLSSPDLFVDDRVHYICDDILHYVETCEKKYDIIAILYVLQFLSDTDRNKLIKGLRNIVTPYTSIVLADKFLSRDPYVDRMNEDFLRDFKRASGFTRQEIDGKKESLAGVQLRIKDGIQDTLAAFIGFKTVELLDSSLNFKCYMIRK